MRRPPLGETLGHGPAPAPGRRRTEEPCHRTPAYAWASTATESSPSGCTRSASTARAARRALATELHGQHSVYWTTGHMAEPKAVLLDPALLRRSRRSLP